jgi:hypothetical protein
MKPMLCFAALGIVLVLGLITTAFGQSSPQPLWKTQVLIETDCNSSLTNCSASENPSESMEVTVPSIGQYILETWISCSDPQSNPCGGCYACAHLIRESDNHDMFGAVHTTCETPCDISSLPISLQNGVTYKLHVSKKPCENHDCANCSSSCQANAVIRSNF